MQIFKGEVNGIRYEIDESVAKRLKQLHNIDAVAEITSALEQFQKHTIKDKHEAKGNAEQGTGK